MSELCWLTDKQTARLRPFFPTSRGKTRVDDRRVLRGIIFIQRNGLMWKHAPSAFGPPKTIYDRWTRRRRMGVGARVMTELAAQAQAQAQDTWIVRIDVEPVVQHRSEYRWRGQAKAHRTALSLAVQTGALADRGRLIGRPQGGLNSKLQVLTDANDRPIRLLLSAGQTSDEIGARAPPFSIPRAGALLAACRPGLSSRWAPSVRANGRGPTGSATP